ncbi:MAG: peptide ABC transporter, partial [Marivirga sp.]|nr:peptide ABC transporter [Marivirga sp.]
MTIFLRITTVFSFVILSPFCRAGDETPEKAALKYINEIFHEADIPGMSVVLIVEGKPSIHHFGYSNADKSKAVSNHTLFQLGSCSKAFTALVVWKLVKEGAIELDAPVAKYIPWFRVWYKEKSVDITVKQLLNHTSGIPWNSIARIPITNAKNALEQTVKTLLDIELRELPGRQFEYATINYDVLALIVERVTNHS